MTKKLMVMGRRDQEIGVDLESAREESTDKGHLNRRNVVGGICLSRCTIHKLGSKIIVNNLF